MVPLRLLIVEDSEDDAALVIRRLASAGYAVAAERVETSETLTAALQRERWDLAIADYTMPQFSGTAALSLLREHDAEMPFIFVSGTIGEDAAVNAMKTGAQDYIIKGNLARLGPAVERELREAASRRARKQAEARLAHLAYHDPLTDLPNRMRLDDRLQQAVLLGERTGTPVALMVLDLDEFKTINDSLGHHAGDLALQQVALGLRSRLREVDTVARLGGDEFALLLPATNAEGASLTARKILRELASPMMIAGRPVVVRGSVGIACYPEHGSDADTLLRKADIAMYVAKSSGLGYAVYAPDRDRRANRHLTLLAELREGIELDQFAFDYQPIVELRSGKVLSVEALARWRHPRQTHRLPPSEFIELAERTGLIDPLTTLLLTKAIKEWVGSDSTLQVPVAVNLSPRNLRDPDLPNRIADLLQFYSAPTSALVLEITENLILADPEPSTRCLARLHEMGVQLAIDDFGAGYSSLSYLQRLPVHELKIDRSLISGLTPGADAIVRSTIDLAHNLGLRVVAEGVEDDAVRAHLLELGCDAAQGFLIARPESPDETRSWVSERNARWR